MIVNIGKSKSTNVSLAVTEATTSFKNPVLLLFFAPVSIFEEVAVLIHQQFPSAISAGVSSCICYTNDDVLRNELLITSFESGIDCVGGVIEEISRYPLKYAPQIESAVQSLPATDNTVCIEFTAAFSMSEELVLASLDSVCSKYKIPVFGGTAECANPVQPAVRPQPIVTERISYTAYNGQVLKDGSVFVLLHNKQGRIRIYQENIYKPDQTVLLSTSVNVRERIVHEFNGRPAVDALCTAIRCIPSELVNFLSVYQLGRKSGDEYFISAIDTILPDGSITFFTRIYNNVKMFLMEPANYKTTTAQTLQRIRSEISNPSAVFMIHCEGRALLYDSNEYLQQYITECGNTLGPLFGFSSLGEQLHKQHFNYTMIAMVFE